MEASEYIVDIRHLEYFSEVAKHLNFTKAAAVLHISQPSLSKAIKNLEEELGVPLFYRSSKQMELTDAGKAVLVNARKVIDGFKNLTSELTDVIELKKGEIRIGISPTIDATFFSKLIGDFKEAYPLVKLILTEVGTKTIKQGIDDGSLDVGFISKNFPIQKEFLNMIDLYKDPLMLIVHKNHPLALKEEIDFSDLKTEPFILYQKTFSLFDRIIERCTKKDFYPNIICESSQKDFMIELVETNLGIALLPKRICKKIYSKDIIAIPFKKSQEINLELAMIWKKDKYIPFAVSEFISMSEKVL